MVDAPAADVAIDISSPRPPRIETSLRGFWAFSEGTGATARDRVPPPPSKAAMDLSIASMTAVTWVAGGLRIDGNAKISSLAQPHVGQAIEISGQFTVELWASPENATQGAEVLTDGPDYAVMFTASGSIVSRDATIAQVGDRWMARSRTTATDNNGLPEIRTPAGVVKSGVPTHLVLSTTSTTRTLYVNGTPYTSSPSGIGMLNWDRSYTLRVGDEDIYDRQWHGTAWMMAIYDRALSDAEIQQNFQAGFDCPSC